jgi:hypothetical protein
MLLLRLPRQGGSAGHSPPTPAYRGFGSLSSFHDLVLRLLYSRGVSDPLAQKLDSVAIRDSPLRSGC